MLPLIEELLAPISEAFPCGEDMSFSSEFDEIQEARREDDPTLEQGDWVTTLKEADWKLVAGVATNILKAKSKDLRVGSWLCEALAKTEGLGGLVCGVQVINGLVENYWNDFHPLAEDGDQEQRIGNISWLISRSSQLVKEFPVARNGSIEYSLLQLESARALQSAIERNVDIDSSELEGKPTLQIIKGEQGRTTAQFYLQAITDTETCITAVKKLSANLDDRLGMDGPSFSALVNALDGYLGTLRNIAAENNIGAPVAAAQQEGPAHVHNSRNEATQATFSAVPAHAGELRSREQALKQLRDVAEFFRKTEPHSPVAYLAEKAASWGEMPLHQWLKTVLKDDSSLSRFEDLLGFNSSESNN